MKNKSQNAATNSKNMSASTPSLEVLIDSLLKEATENFEETPSLKWEWEHYLRLSSLIQKIRERETSRDSQDKSEVDDNTRRVSELPEFIQWLMRNEAVFSDKVDITSFENSGFGLKTNVELKAGELAFSVPQSIVISVEKARSSKLSPLIDKDPILCNMQNVLIAVFLLFEKYVNADSFWKPYLRILPSKFDTVAYYSETEMTLLKTSPRAFRESLRMYRHISRQYAYFHTKFKNSTNQASKSLKKIFTYNRYTWAVSAVSTRINNWPNKQDTLCMVPLLDLCNHDGGQMISTEYNDDSGSFLCYAGQDYSKNMEFTMFYGHRSSVDFLIHNGFVPNNYRDDVYFLDLSIGPNTVNSSRKTSLLKDLNMDCKSTFQLSPDRINSIPKLFAFIKIFTATEEKLSLYKQTNKEDLAKMLDEPSLESLQYLEDRFELMKRVVDNSIASVLQSFCKDLKSNDVEKCETKDKADRNCSKVSRNILQLLQNELKLLGMLAHACKEFKNSFRNKNS